MVATFSLRLSTLKRGWVRRWTFVGRECLGAVVGGGVMRLSQFLKTDLFADSARDLRHAARALARKPGVTVNAVLALGLGIGLPTLMFCFIYGALLRPLPVPDGERILHLEYANPVQGLQELDVSYHDFLDWKDRQEVFEDMAAFYRGTVNLSGGDRPERFFGAFITANTLDVLRVRPALGRGFLAGEDHPSADRVVLISDAVWRSRFDASATAVGAVIRVNGEPTTVVGIMPEGFGFPYWEDVWLPLRFDPLAMGRGTGPGLEVFGRLRSGATLELARAELQLISRELADEWPDTNRDLEAVVEGYTASYHDQDGGAPLAIMLLTALAVLLIASFNVANLLLARAVTRTREVAIRVAMGASRRRVVATLLQEAGLLALAGAAVGTLFALVGVAQINRAVLAAATYPPPFWMSFRMDAPILLFVAALTGLSAMASGLVPAIKASGTNVRGLLQDASLSGSALRISRLSRSLVLGELTVSALLLVVSGHLAQEVTRTRNADYGYPADDVLTARLGLFEGVVPDRESRLAFYRDLQVRLASRHEIASVALTTTLPGEEAPAGRFAVEGTAYAEEADVPRARMALVSPGFFEALGIPMIAGRGFRRSDDAGSLPVAIVNRSFAQRFLPDGEPLGAQIREGRLEGISPWRTVVGVVPDLNMDGALDPAGTPQGVYLPIAQSDARFMSVAVRTSGDSLALASVIRDEVSGLQGDTPIYFVRTLRDAINVGLLDMLLMGGIFVGFGVAAFLLAAVGLYGVTAFLAGQRTREVGIRMALGAEGGAVLGLVLHKGLRQVLGGLALGLLLAGAARQGLGAAGVGVAQWDLGVTAAVCLTLGLTWLAAVGVPAWRSTRVDPVVALQQE
jgi:predicted permease